MSHLLVPLPQDALRDPAKWNAEDRYLSRLGHRGDLDFSLNSYQGLMTNTCAIQARITDEALHHFTRNNFEVKWMMARGPGRMSVMLEDTSFIPSQPLFVPHPTWDAWAAAQRQLNHSEAEKVALAYIMILRTKLICHVLHFTIRSFFGKDFPQLLVEKQHEKPKLHTTPLSEVAAVLGPEAAKARAKEEKAGLKVMCSQRVNCCSYLGCTKIEAPDGSENFPRCEPCFQKIHN
ncbi:MYND-type domain-containing protein [Mycena venus]|uniref:MYND-type domain-containing protein n=1 Tax=Mycena venus TaxID=2733690 RepID=A0A8H6YE86_9AGAR|nr:MYND-type domain-containing protein [Mycena venus]